MQQNIIAFVALGLLVGANAAAAATILQCEDAEGNRSFETSCPPGSKLVEEKNYYTGPKNSGPDLDSLQAEQPVTLYSVPACEACDVVRSYLNSRDTPFTEKNVENNVDLQEELSAITGELSVPVVTIGEAMVAGYNRAELKEKLDSAGYPDEKIAGHSQQQTTE